MKYTCVLLCVVVLAACSMPSHVAKEGGVTITITNGISQRTLYPDTPVFTKYVLSFTSEAGVHEDVTFEGDAVTVTDLEPGEWVITATGYVTIEGEELPAASGSVEVTVISGIPADVEITIEAERSSGGDDGFFRYSVSVASNIELTRAELSLTPFFSGGGSNRYNKGLADFSEDGLTDFVPLEPGFYLMTIRLASNDGYKTVGLADIVHIYSNMETNWERTFIPADFADAKTYSLTVGVIKEQTGIWGDGEPYGEVYFYIGDDSTEKTTTATFPEDAEVTVTITAQANGIRLNMVGNQDPWFFVLEDNYKGPGVEDFIEDFYVEGDSTVYTGTTAFTKTFTFTITKDITLYAIFNGDGYDRPKNFTADYWAELELSPTKQQEMMDMNFALMEDLDLDDLGATWTPIGGGDNPPFIGTFDGRGHTIKLAKTTNVVNANNVDISTCAGLFGHIGEGGTVKNLILEGSIKCYAGGVGALAGCNEGIIQNIMSMVAVTNDNGSGYSGGIAGYNIGAIFNCVSIGNVSGTKFCGGIAGYLDGGEITGCWVSGVIKADTNLGNITGRLLNGSSVNKCVALNGVLRWDGAWGRIGYRENPQDGSFSNNYAFADMVIDYAWDYENEIGINKTLPLGDVDADGIHGGNVRASEIADRGWWRGGEGPGWTIDKSGGPDETDPWVWDDVNNLPKLWFDDKGWTVEVKPIDWG